MIGGALIVAVCLLILGWTGEIVRLFVGDTETVSVCNNPSKSFPAHDGLQAKSYTIALAVLSIYAVDFAINAGWCSARIEQTDRKADGETSPVFVPKSHCRHSANCKAAAWFCLGYALLPCIREYTNVVILKQAE